MSLLQLALSDFSNMASIVFKPGPSHCITEEMETTFIYQLLNRDAPKLTSFKVHCERHEDNAQSWTLRDELDLSSLKILKLSGQPFNVMQRFFRPTLTHLNISWHDNTQTLLFADLLEHLSQMPLLESLKIRTGCYRLSNDTYLNHATNRRLQFPRLRHFEVNSAYRHCRALLSSISFPVDTRIAFSILIASGERPLERPIDPDALLPVFGETLRDLAARGSSSAMYRPLLSAFLQFRDSLCNEWSHILAWDRTQHGEDVSVYELPQTGADINISMGDLDYYNAFRALRRFYNTLPLSNLVHLVIRDAQRTCPSAYWTRLVNAVPALEHLDITGSAHALICCLNAIIGDSLEDKDDDEGESPVHAPLPLPLPHLTHLTMGPGGRKPRSGNTREDFIDVLASTLRARFRGAHPIQRLKILWGSPADRDRLEMVCSRWVNRILFDWDPKYPEGEVDYLLDEIMDDSSRASSAEDSESDEET
ncbi:hypothetical protein NLI96_g1025 [Meripilus lineatus]|uniref:F-box domain-containing protein n=1 Tax=Meripilus lineatus TaxID=2056292 RepID=A0AAD5YLF9_9APHY|nr:hypothetical protein NLI96_g1025 [Physisporinus lineatus]